ncbi:hypothetical protein ACQ4PT_048600 [Festuca glaucescens]
MASTRAKNEDDKALVLCQERKRYVREALDGRCALAAAHFAYIQSLRHTGFALRKFVEPDVPTDSSLYTSTSATPEPPAVRHRSVNLSPSVSHQASDSFSPAPSPLSSGRFHVNRMKAGRNQVRTVEEKVPVPVTATLQTSSSIPYNLRLREKEGIPELEEELEKFHAHDGDIKRSQQEKTPDVKDGDKSTTSGREDDFEESEDDFENPSSEPLVRMFANRNDTPVENTVTNQSPAHRASEKVALHTPVENTVTNQSPAHLSLEKVALHTPVENTVTNQSPAHLASEKVALENIDSKTEEPKIDNRVLDISMYETDESPVASPVKEVSSSVAAFPMNGKTKEPFRDVRNGVKDLYTSMKEVEILFIKASDCGKEVPRMLEADKVNFRPLLPEEKAYGLKASGFFATLFACCREEVPVPQPPPEAEVKYLTWHRSVSSHSSSSRNPLGPASKVDVDGLTGNIFSGVYMNSGSHASTLDRLYAWERKLYDEVKASGTICRQYDEKCRHLRHQESRGENQLSIDKTRATVKDLYSRILVAIQRIDMVSKNIEDLRDKELQPQLEELVGSLTRMWTTMLECHRHQHDIIKLVSNSGNMKILVRTESQFQATLLLQVELNTLCLNFQRWIGSHKSYLNSLHSWLLKCVKSLRKKKKSRKKKDTDFQITDYAVAPIFTICDQWIKLLENLPTDDLEKAIKGLVADINHCVPRQEKRRGGSRSTFSVPHNGGWNDEMGANHRNVPPTDLQSSLETFLGKLANFSDASLQKYTELKVNIDKAKEDYEKYN